MMTLTRCRSPMLGMSAFVCTLLISGPIRADEPVTIQEAIAGLRNCFRVSLGDNLTDAGRIVGQSLSLGTNTLQMGQAKCHIIISPRMRVVSVYSNFLTESHLPLKDVNASVLRELSFSHKELVTFLKEPNGSNPFIDKSSTDVIQNTVIVEEGVNHISVAVNRRSRSMVQEDVPGFSAQ